MIQVSFNLNGYNKIYVNIVNILSWIFKNISVATSTAVATVSAVKANVDL